MNVITEIINRVKNRPTNGITVLDNSTNPPYRILPFTTLKGLKEKGFESVENYLNSLPAQGYEDIQVHLKQRTGTSSVYVRNLSAKVQFKKEVAKPSEQPQAPDPINSGAGYSQTPQTPTETMQPYQTPTQPAPNGLNAAVGLGFAETVKMYSASEQKAVLEKQNAELKAKIENLTAKNESLKEENRKQEMQLFIKNSERKTLVSDEVAGSLMQIAPQLLSALKGGTPTGLNAAQPQEPVNIFADLSETKQALIDVIADNDFNDDLALKTYTVTQNLIANPNILDQPKK